MERSIFLYYFFLNLLHSFPGFHCVCAVCVCVCFGFAMVRFWSVLSPPTNSITTFGCLSSPICVAGSTCSTSMYQLSSNKRNKAQEKMWPPMPETDLPENSLFTFAKYFPNLLFRFRSMRQRVGVLHL